MSMKAHAAIFLSSKDNPSAQQERFQLICLLFIHADGNAVASLLVPMS